ncbi:uncharacterized protein LOC110847587 [Folsomia candida]|uniref:uncharacterized protein LOC110847587 n=1 Tax=Folsomia candida TaxID=158441 RepID=UPI000B902B2E|nr:uncharacterized protein LOC110847587 [Folsomia candida]
MEYSTIKYTVIGFAIILGVFQYSDGQKDHGEACSLRSQIADFFRSSNSSKGCISEKGLVCVNHKCTCMDPSNVYEVPEPTESGSMGSDISSAASAASSFIKNLIRGSTTTTTTTTTPSTPTSGAVISGGKCVGRAGSPCFRQNSTCVKHAVCEGSPRICKCQGIYGSNGSGYCSKTANVVSQVIKSTVG